MARSIAGLFPDRQSAEQAIVDLKTAGFDASKMGIVLRDHDASIAVAREQGIPSTEGAVTGGLIGGSLGAILVAVGALAIPGVGPFISGGVLATLIGGTAGWLVGGLATLGIPEDEARYYEGEVQQGRALVTVDAGGRDEEARAIMLRDGAEDLRARGFGVSAAEGQMKDSLPDVPRADEYADVANTPADRRTEPAGGIAANRAAGTIGSTFTPPQTDEAVETEAVAYGKSGGPLESDLQPEEVSGAPRGTDSTHLDEGIRHPFPGRNMRDRA